MNKTEFIKELAKQIGYSEEDCIKINEVLEDNSLIGRKNKNKTVADFMEKLNYSEEEANKIYEVASKIIFSQIKEKIRHPFKSQD